MELIQAFFLTAFILSLFAFGFSLFAVVKVLAWQKTEFKVIPMSQPETSGLEDIAKQMVEAHQERMGDLQALQVDTDDLV